MFLAGLRGACRPQDDAPSLQVVAFGALVLEEGEEPFLKDDVGSRNSRRIIKADSHISCRAHAVPLPCRAAKDLECVFPI